ncbi:MAG: AsmA family protein [Gammaproteobacteria bacterium]|nr:AsmA family protein [Gammaproteobacteria bacterium]
MVKLLKLLGWLLGILVVLVLAAVVLVPMFVDPNEHKERIVSEVKKATGRDLTISGEIGFSVIPWLGLDLNGLSLSNAPGFGDQKFASVERAKVRVNLIPLILKQTLVVDTVELKGLALNLARSQAGVSNWDDLTGKEEDKDADASPDDPDRAGGKRLVGYTIGGVAIQDARVVWDDQSTGEHYEIKGLHLETGSLSPGKAVEVRLALEVESRQPQMQAAFELTGLLNANPEQQRVSLERLILELAVKGEGLPKDGVKAQLKTDVKVDHRADTLEVKGLTLDSGALALQGELVGRGISANPVIEGNFRLDEFSPREWMERFDIPVPETADQNVLSKLSLSANLNASSNHLALDKIAMTLDDSLIKGDLELLNLAEPGYRFNLDLDQLNLDRYLPPVSENAETQRPPAARKEEALFPVEMLRKLKMEGTLRINTLIAKKIRAEAIEVKVASSNGQLKIDQQVGRFYDGLIKGGVALDVRGKTPKLTINQKASRILAGPLLRDATETDKLEGSGGFSANLTGSGQSVSQLKRSLNGSLDFSFRDGTVKGINLAKMIREAKAKLSGESLAITHEPEQTDFSEMNGSATVQNGILTNRDLLAKSPYLRVDGSGKVNLVMENLDYTIRPVIVSSAKGQGGQGLDELVGIPIPIHFEGAWAKPEWRIDLAKALQEQQKAKVKEKVESKIQEKLPELKDKLPEGLKGLF